MPLQAKVGSFSSGTGALSSTVAVTGVGFQPKAILFWWSGRSESTDAIGRATLYRGFGAVAGTTDRQAAGTTSADAAASIDAARLSRNDAVVAVMTAAGVVDGLLDLQSFDSDGFTLVVDDVMPRDQRISYLALGGTSLTNAATGFFSMPVTTGNFDYTSLAWQPDCVIFFSSNLTSDPPNDSASRGHLMIGAATGSANQGVWSAGVGPESNATSQSKSYATDAECIAFLGSTPTTVSARAAFVSFLSNGFRLNALVSSSARRVQFIALKGGNYLVESLLTQTDTVTAITESGFGFAPSGVLFVSHGQTKSTTDTVQTHDRLSIGAASSTSSRTAQGTLDEDGLADTQVSTAIEHDEVYVNISTSSTIDGLMDLQSLDSGGFTAIMDDADPAQAFVWYLAVGPGGATVYNQSVAGGLTPAGALVNRPTKIMAGGLTPAGALVKRATKIAAGTVTTAGALVKRATKIVAGALTPSGAVTRTKTYLQILAGTVTSSGTVVKRATKVLAGSLTPAGGVVKRAAKILAGSLTPAGVVARAKTFLQIVAGSLTPSGVVVKRATKIAAGALTPSGAVVKRATKIVAGALTPAGVVVKRATKVLVGTVSAVGELLSSLQIPLRPLLDHIVRLWSRRKLFILTGDRTIRVPARRRYFRGHLMAVAEVPKDPEEELTFRFDYTDLLDDGDTVSSSSWSASGVTVADDDMTSTTTTVKLTGGTLGTKNKVKNTVITTNGEKIVRRLVVVIQEM